VIRRTTTQPVRRQSKASEALGLTVPRVDFLRRKIHVLSQAQRGQIAADLKTEPSTRTIPADE
jgi:hypothetical protein